MHNEANSLVVSLSISEISRLTVPGRSQSAINATTRIIKVVGTRPIKGAPEEVG
jgi:hypothetical protein